MPTQARAELARNIARHVAAVRTSRDPMNREALRRTLVQLEAELAEMDRAAAFPRFSYQLAAVQPS